MPDHIRKRIRHAAATALRGLRTTGGRVFPSRIYPLQEDDLPALLISNPGEEIEPLTMTQNATLERALNLEVRAAVQQVKQFEDAVDQIMKEVEKALAADPTLGGLCHSLQLTRISTDLAGEGEKPIAVATMEYQVQYYTHDGAPDVAL